MVTYSTNIPARITARLLSPRGLRRLATRALQRLPWPKGHADRTVVPANLRRDVGLPPQPETRRYWELG